MITVRNLTLRRGTKVVLEGTGFTLQPGEKASLVGRNGAGKSTLLKMLLGLYRPDEGQLRVGGVDVRQIDPADLRRHVGMAFEDATLFSQSVRDNVLLGREESLARIRDQATQGVNA